MTHHVESQKLSNEVQEHKTRHVNITNSHMFVSHEIRTPLSSCLMLLEGLLFCDQVSESARRIVLIIISQVNLLISLVNDMLDLKLIEEKKFVPKQQSFRPRETFEFIHAMFESQMKI